MHDEQKTFTPCTGHTHTSSVLAFVAASVMALLVFFGAPHQIYAKEYSITAVSIDAGVDTQGNLLVLEKRTFSFEGDFNGVYWDIPSGVYEGKTITPQISQVGLVENDQMLPFTATPSGENSTYQLSQKDNAVEVKLYSKQSDTEATFYISYVLPQLATRWQDTAELYWKFVSDGWDVESQNVSCTIHLPVPTGQTVTAGQNVSAWGHGPLDATVSFVDGAVRFQVPGVGTSEYAEARIVFPANWLTEATTTPQDKLESIKNEEAAWAQKANETREAARRIGVAITVLSVIGAFVGIASSLWLRQRYKKEHTPTFTDEYYRDVPSADHPAVLGALYSGGKVDSKCLTASLMRLCDLGIAKLEVETTEKTGLLGNKKTKNHFVLVKTDAPAAGKDVTRADKETVRFIFDKVAPLLDGQDNASEPSVNFDLLENFDEDNAEPYLKAYDNWKSSIEGEAISRGFFIDESSFPYKGICGILIALLGAGAIGVILAGVGAELIQISLMLLSFALLVLAIVVLIMTFKSFTSYSREALELKAQLDALRRWLCEFTRLNEAVPTDLILWNRLLVMAVVLGVADKVIEQLKVTMPQMLEDPAIQPIYGWYYWPHMGSAPYESFNQIADQVHSVSVAELAGSAFSSTGGSGGGFSGGGGGGFGGGGGGGAF